MTGMWAIILAAGESRRMGSPKMLLPFNGTTVIGQVIENVLAAGVIDTLVIAGADREEIIKAVKSYPVQHSYNDNFRSGMLSSVQCGFAFLPDHCHAALIVPGDQPMISAMEIKKVMEAWKESGKGIVMPVYNGKRGHPLVVDMKYRAEVLSLPEEDGLRALAARHPDDVIEAETDDQSVLRDIDTREDYLNELKIIKNDGRDNPVQT
jgi:molybdenum cofactor cytidylyltransferase